MKKYLGYVLGGFMALALAAPALMVSAPVHAQLDEGYFGGSDATDFAGTAGLGTGDLPATIASIIRVAMGFLGIVAVVIILYGGFMWMTAAGNDDKVKKAKSIMIAGVIGLVIIVSAFAIANFVLTQITTAVAE